MPELNFAIPYDFTNNLICTHSLYDPISTYKYMFQAPVLASYPGLSHVFNECNIENMGEAWVRGYTSPTLMSFFCLYCQSLVYIKYRLLPLDI